MTRRDFDAATKLNLGDGLARDERCSYRTRRMREHDGSGCDYPTRTRIGLIDERAWWNARRNHAWRTIDGTVICSNRDGFLPVLALGSQWRSVAAHRARVGLPLLEHRAVSP